MAASAQGGPCPALHAALPDHMNTVGGCSRRPDLSAEETGSGRLSDLPKRTQLAASEPVPGDRDFPSHHPVTVFGVRRGLGCENGLGCLGVVWEQLPVWCLLSGCADMVGGNGHWCLIEASMAQPARSP